MTIAQAGPQCSHHGCAETVGTSEEHQNAHASIAAAAQAWNSTASKAVQHTAPSCKLGPGTKLLPCAFKASAGLHSTERTDLATTTTASNSTTPLNAAPINLQGTSTTRLGRALDDSAVGV